MKTKLLFLLSLFTAAGFSQAPIGSYYGNNLAAYTTMSGALDQSGAGADQSWTFTGLTMTGDVLDTNATPSPGEIVTYPGSTASFNTSGSINSTATSSTVYSSENAGVISITGVDSDGLQLNYVTDNATVGTYPLNYGYTNTDAVAGVFHYTTYTGTFTGTLNTSVDAYGTLTLDSGPPAMAVTRLKTEQTLNLFYPGFGNVGTVTIISYSYFGTGLSSPVFRTATTTMLVPLLSINQTETRIEAFTAILLGTDHPIVSGDIHIINPAKDFLTIQSGSNQTIHSVSIMDINGRLILKTNNAANSLNVSALQKGTYLASVTTDAGTVVKKIIKE